MRLQAIAVKGEEVSPISDTGIKTRSKAAQGKSERSGPRSFSDCKIAPTSWTMIPVLVKIFKLLLSEVRNQLESNASGKADGQNDSSENEVVFSFSTEKSCEISSLHDSGKTNRMTTKMTMMMKRLWLF